MTLVSPMIDGFNAGELSPRLHGQIRLNRYAAGLHLAENVICTQQGPVTKESGTVYVAAAKGPCRLIDFSPFLTQGYIIEASAGALRFYTNDAQIISMGLPYEISAPWTFDQLQVLDWAGNNDVMIFCHPDVSPRKLTRTSAVTFSLTERLLQNGPFEADNADDSITVTASAVSGAGVTLTASAPIFAATDVGGLFRIEVMDYNQIGAWEPGLTVSNGNFCWSGLNVYECVSSTAGQRTGTRAPEHVEGAEFDGLGFGTDINAKGPYGVKWQYLHGRYGTCRITGYTSPTVVTVEVLRRLPFAVGPFVSNRWAHGAFSDTRGWPNAFAFWGEREVYAKGNVLYGGVIGGNDDFSTLNAAGEFGQDQAFIAPLPDPNAIVSLSVDRGVLIINAVNAHYYAEAQIIQGAGPIPPQINIRRGARHGAAQARALPVHGEILYITRVSRKIRAMAFQAVDDRYTSPDITRYSDQIGASGFVELVLEQEPENIIRAPLGNGELASCVYVPEEDVIAWSRRKIADGLYNVKRCAAIPDPTGKRDQLWSAVERNGQWSIIRHVKLWETGDVRSSAFFVDLGLSGSSAGGIATTVFGGLNHLSGQSVGILTDGSPHPDKVVSATGTITLDWPAVNVVAGLRYTARIKTLRIETGASDGVSQGKIKRISRIILRLIESLGFSIGSNGADLNTVEFRDNDDLLDEPVPLFSGDKVIENIGDVGDRNGHIDIVSDSLLPFTLSAIMPVVDVGVR